MDYVRSSFPVMRWKTVRGIERIERVRGGQTARLYAGDQEGQGS